MAGFEVIVRPVVFPNIRPAPTRSLPPEDDPKKGVCVIHGSGGQLVDLPASWSASSSKSRSVESKRRVDEVRVYQKDDKGKVNKKNFVDVNATTKLYMVDPNVGHMERDNKGGYIFVPAQGYATRKEYFMRPQESDNVEILEKDKIIKNPDAPAASTP